MMTNMRAMFIGMTLVLLWCDVLSQLQDGCVVCNHLYNNSVTSHEGYGSEPYDRGETYTICRTIPVATIGIEMIFESLQIGDKQTDSTDDCFGTAAQTDIDQITVKNGKENIFQCGGVGFTRPFHIKRDINSPDNHLSFKLASSEKSYESYDGFNISYTLTACPDVEGGQITRLGKENGSFYFDMVCLYDHNKVAKTHICQKNGTWLPTPECNVTSSTTTQTTTTTTTKTTTPTTTPTKTTTTTTTTPTTTRLTMPTKTTDGLCYKLSCEKEAKRKAQEYGILAAICALCAIIAFVVITLVICKKKKLICSSQTTNNGRGDRVGDQAAAGPQQNDENEMQLQQLLQQPQAQQNDENEMQLQQLLQQPQAQQNDENEMQETSLIEHR